MFGICCLFCHAPSAGHTTVLLLFALILPSDLLHNFGWEIYRDQGCPKMTGVLFGPGGKYGGGGGVAGDDRLGYVLDSALVIMSAMA